MTAHRAALSVTTEVSGVTRVGFRTAGAPQGVRPVSRLLSPAAASQLMRPCT